MTVGCHMRQLAQVYIKESPTLQDLLSRDQLLGPEPCLAIRSPKT